MCARNFKFQKADGKTVCAQNFKFQKADGKTVCARKNFFKKVSGKSVCARNFKFQNADGKTVRFSFPLICNPSPYEQSSLIVQIAKFLFSLQMEGFTGARFRLGTSLLR